MPYEGKKKNLNKNKICIFYSLMITLHQERLSVLKYNYAKENEDTTIMWVEYDFQEYDSHSITLF